MIRCHNWYCNLTSKVGISCGTRHSSFCQ